MGRTAHDGDANDAQGIPLTLGDNQDLIGDDEDLDRGQQLQPNPDLSEDGDDDDLDDAISGIQGQLEELRQNDGNQQQFLQNMLLQLTQAQQQSQSQGNNNDGDQNNLDLSDLPDPVNDRDGFNKELGKRVNQHLTKTSQDLAASFQQQSSQSSQLSDLENRFMRNYGELSKKTALFEVSVRQEVQDLMNRGMSKQQAQQYVFANPDQFLGGVATRMKSELGITEDDDDQDFDDADLGDGGRQRKVPRTLSAKRQNSRARVRGQSSPGSRVRKRGRQQPKPKGFIEQMKQAQQDSGLF